MVSWGPPKDGGEKFYKGMKHEKPWVQDLNWSNRCKLESKKFMKKKIMQHTLASNAGSSIPPYGISIIENTSPKFLSEAVNVKELDYFFTNAISRASKTMSECRQIRHNSKKTGTDNL